MTVKSPESGKFKDEPKGLGHWRCSITGLAAKVSPRKPQPKSELAAGVIAVQNASVVPVEGQSIDFVGEVRIG